jgi:flagellar motor switch protein FliN/FliY
MADEAEQLGQDQIEKLLQKAEGEPAAASDSDGPPAATDDQALGRHEIDALLNGVDASPPPPDTAAAGPGPIAAADASSGEESATGDDVHLLLEQAEQAIASIDEPAEGAVEGMKPFRLEDFSGTPASSEKASLDLLRDVELDLQIELGRTRMHLEEVLKLRRGSVVPLDKLAGDPVDIYVNGRLIARGEVLVLNDSFCVRVAELIAGDEVG